MFYAHSLPSSLSFRTLRHLAIMSLLSLSRRLWVPQDPFRVYRRTMPRRSTSLYGASERKRGFFHPSSLIRKSKPAAMTAGGERQGSEVKAGGDGGGGRPWFRRVFHSGWVRSESMRYPEQSLTENEEKDRWKSEKERKEEGVKGGREKVRGMNLYREETKGEERRGKEKNDLARMYTCIYTSCTCVYGRRRERNVKPSLRERREQWETKRNGRVSEYVW